MATKVRDRYEQKMARLIQKTEKIKYTEALRRVRAWLEATKENEDGQAADQSGDQGDRQGSERPSADGVSSGRGSETVSGESADSDSLGNREDYTLAAPSGS